MAEASRTDAARRNMHYSTKVPEPNDPLGETPLDLPELPESASPANNPALNRSAVAVGRGVGTAVAGVRRLPQQLDRLRSRIHLVPRRDRVAGAVEEVRESALEAAGEWRDAAEETLDELKRRAELYTDEIAGNASRRWEGLHRQTMRRIQALRRDARQWLAAAHEWESKRPLYVIGTCAAAAFAAGVALRIWRTNGD